MDKLNVDNWINDIREVERMADGWQKASKAAELLSKVRMASALPVGADLTHGKAIIYRILGQASWEAGRQGSAAMWLSRALSVKADDKQSQQLMNAITLAGLTGLTNIFPLSLIRELDPAEFRRKEISRLLKVLHKFRMEELPNIAEQIKATAESDKNDVWRKLRSLVHTILERIPDAEEAGGTYMESIQGMFSSGQLLEEFNESISLLNTLAAEWDELLAPYRVEHTSELTALEKLDRLIGMREIKSRIHELYYFLLYLKMRREKGFSMKDQVSLHSILMGNPGTGKTTIARLLAEIYHELNILEQPKIIEVDRSHLIGSFIGQTEQKVMDVIKQAVGGVLFIDEAYSLKRTGSAENDFGQVAIDTLVAAMTGGEYAGKFAVMLAGYPEEMRNFLQANPGLRSRFPESGHFTLEDFSQDELMQIGVTIADDNQFVMTASALASLSERLEQERVDQTFGNARAVKNIVLDAIIAKGRKLSASQQLPEDEFAILYPEDFQIHLPEVRPAVEQLKGLVGLQEIKAEIRRLFAFLTIQQERKERDMPAAPLQLHAIFTGNSGTGKSTVAQIYASVLKEAGFLKRGHLVTAGRADLVGEYVGQTAIKTERKIREALGGVLFIDEAYSLLGERGDYGREAVDTLVEEITKHNENLVVILAGYPELMEDLLDSNPGLRSRFKKRFTFPDYTADELVQVAADYARNLGYDLEDEAATQLQEYFLSENQDVVAHGNARFARSTIEEAIQQQASRLMANDGCDRTRKQLITITKQDIPLTFLL
ncbi:AAA family ATPase [Aneurinibacillus sp. Ricciae_BoGa-3]|uniref:AAA family ATPase n=1 Tax=Aneurinibacillus sp. Ricciae_BoGa-3 TaxID=3022697 RepID=UPI0023425692|nr:AAA family ATPase [Aneurinibacillus sp. Ricciae_BoGa-3]WCK55851.1 AAA family ATPase [Aneurinibacillus sp. Ricciae_BoGa-3]